ncbi:hypothetical protein [Ciceribacter sp. L1K22]|uniref:hypothetical protein n=2 Tax=unclassified Ciceribacter TaxID=2628820 RepID=UPI001ABEDF20|nr:hypothetical protein [Ciceribacter sp. L1K22]MBO3759445.1 hypothetical protein [Ciceribacter sp. L1K22]
MLSTRTNRIFAPAFALSLLAAPALAQSADTTDTGTSSTTSTGSSQSGTGGIDPTTAQNNVRDRLNEAGFQQVEILDASYLVRAQTEDGNTVLMVIDPPMRGMGTSGSDTSGTSGSSGTSDSN